MSKNSTSAVRTGATANPEKKEGRPAVITSEQRKEGAAFLAVKLAAFRTPMGF